MKESQKILASQKITIFVDSHEPQEMFDFLAKYDCIIIKKQLSVGDYLCSSRVCIERKTHQDFIGSIINGRIFEQAKNLKENFEKPIILIEGYSNRRINENALKAAIASLLIDFGVSILTTKNPSDTARTIYWIARKEQEEKKKGLALKIRKKPKELKKLQEFIVCSLPGVSSVISKRLLKKFGSIERIFIASEEELKKVEGIGEKLAKKIKRILSAKY